MIFWFRLLIFITWLFSVSRASLLAYYPFDGTTAPTTVSTCAGGISPTLPSPGTFNGIYVAHSGFGLAASFPQNNIPLSLGILPLSSISNEISVSLHITLNSPVPRSELFLSAGRVPDNNFPQLSALVMGTRDYGFFGAITVRTDSGVYTVFSVADPSPVAASVWNRVAMTFDGFELRLYVNGSVVGSVSATGYFDGCESLNFCNFPVSLAAQANGNNGMACAIDELRFFLSVLSPEDVRVLAETTIAPPSVSGNIFCETENISVYEPAVFHANVSGGGGSFEYSWGLGGLCSDIEIDSSGSEAAFTFKKAGIFRVRVDVSDLISGACYTFEKAFNVLGVRPTILSVSVLEGSAVLLDGQLRGSLGANVSLSTSVVGEPRPQIAWQKLSYVDTGFGNLTLFEQQWVTQSSGNVFDLQISDFENESQWRCFSQNFFGSSSFLFEVVVSEESSGDFGDGSTSDDNGGKDNIGSIIAASLIPSVLALCIFCCCCLFLLCSIVICTIVVLFVFIVIALISIVVLALLTIFGVFLFKRRPAIFRGELSFRELHYDDIEFVREIGGGAFGTVWEAKWHNAEVAVKLLPKDRFGDSVEKLEQFRAEASLMNHLGNHPNVISFVGAVTEGNPDYYCLVTEFCRNGSVFDLLIARQVAVSEPLLIRMARDSAAGLAHLHAEGVLHLDVAARNFLVLNDYRVVVSDFGTCNLAEAFKEEDGLRTISDDVSSQKSGRSLRNSMRMESSESLTSFKQVVGSKKKKASQNVGPVRWLAPEYLRDRTAYTERSDVYSFGIMLWEMVARKKPYEELSIQRVFDGVVTQGLRPDIPATSPRAMAKIMEACWSEEPELRPSMADVHEALSSLFCEAMKLAKIESEDLLIPAIPSSGTSNHSHSNPDSGRNTPLKSNSNTCLTGDEYVVPESVPIEII